MEQTWKLSGVYFEWELVVRVTPADGASALEEADLQHALRRMERLDDYFTDMVSLHEYGVQFNGAERGLVTGWW